MKILSPSQIRQADNFTIENEPVSSIELMERAACAFVSWFIYNFDARREVGIFCGRGNNGGDGLAIARLLLEKEYKVKVYLVLDKDGLSIDCEANYKRFKELQPVNYIKSTADMPEFNEEVVIDGMVGSGLRGPLTGLYAEIIPLINQANVQVVAVDIASGLLADRHQQEGERVKVGFTISFQLPKLAFFMPENQDFVGEWEVVDIGLAKGFLEEAITGFYYADAALVKNILKKRKKFAHKGDFGKALLVAGSKGKMGAAILCTRACLRTGTGLLTVHVPSNCWPLMQTCVQEAMVSVDENDDFFSRVHDFKNYDVVGVGPGLGTGPKTTEGFSKLLQQFKKPMVLDADAINILGKNKDLLADIPKDSILTPHPKEFERIAGSFAHDYERLQMQIDFAQKYQVYLLVKGAHTAIACPNGKVYFNATGNAGMATGGSGDVLTGMITSLLAQGYSSWEAAILGVFLHGQAGDKAATEIGQEALIASDIVDHISDAFQSLHGSK